MGNGAQGAHGMGVATGEGVGGWSGVESRNEAPPTDPCVEAAQARLEEILREIG